MSPWNERLNSSSHYEHSHDQLDAKSRRLWMRMMLDFVIIRFTNFGTTVRVWLQCLGTKGVESSLGSF